MEKFKKLYYVLFPALFMIFVALIPLMSILSDVIKLTSLLFFVIKILYVVILFLLIIVNTLLVVVLIKNIFKQDDIKTSKKVLLTILLVLFSIIVMPYIQHKYINKSVVKPNYLIIYFIAIIFLTIVFAFGLGIYNKKMVEEKQRISDLAKQRETFNEKNNIFSFDFKLDYRHKEVGEYDLYVINKDKNVIFTEFTYDPSLYEQKTLEDYLLKGVSDIESTKKNAKIYKDKKLTELEDKNIYEIIYEGSSETSSTCIYRISAIAFKEKPEIISYVVTVAIKEDYPLVEKEIDEIIKSIKLVQQNE